MGYTHYWRIPPKLEKEKFKILSEELKTAYAFLPSHSIDTFRGEKKIVLADGLGKGQPIFEDKVIRFNGTEKDGMDHETFEIKQEIKKTPHYHEDESGKIFNFCKTAGKPYDLMVCVSLLRLKYHFPETEVSSDGEWKDDWKEARKVYKKIFQENPIKID